MGKSNSKADLLYTIFEQHLFNFQDPNEDRKIFIDQIVKDYLSHMRKVGLMIPTEWDSQINEELSFQVNAMLVKKIYGCLTINEYFSQTEKKRGAKKLTEQRRQAQRRYQELSRASKASAKDQAPVQVLSNSRNKKAA